MEGCSVIINRKKIEIAFPFNGYDYSLIHVMHDLPDCRFDRPHRVWTMPLSDFHAQMAVETLKPLGFWIEPSVIARAVNGKTPKPPKLNIDKRLRPYQRDMVTFLYMVEGRAINGDDMGTGKTPETLVFVDMFIQGRTLVVAPANATYKWALYEIPTWTHNKAVQVVDNGKVPISQADIVVMSYGIMTKRQKELAAIDWDCIIFDESQYLKNYKSLRGKASKVIVKGVPHVICMSGTPFMNKRMELFPNLNLIDPVEWASATTYGTRYCGGEFAYSNGHGFWVTPPDGETNTDELKKRLAKRMLRRTRTEVMPELPPLTRIIQPVTLTNEEEYRRLRHELYGKVQNGTIRKGEHLTYLNRMRHVVGLGKIENSLELALEFLENKEQVVLFAHHKDVVNILRGGLTGYRVGVIDGNTHPNDRFEITQEFQARQLDAVIITLAGAEAIDLYSGHIIIVVERQWNPAKEEQAERRLERRGQRNPVNAYYLVALGTVDEKLNGIVQAKRQQFKTLLNVDLIEEVWAAEFENEPNEIA